jgi:hypothetical protein
MILPKEIQDYIMLFCEGHVRADAGIKTVALPVIIPTCMKTIYEKLELETCGNKYSHAFDQSLFIYKKNTDKMRGYVCKMISEINIYYVWIKTSDF